MSTGRVQELMLTGQCIRQSLAEACRIPAFEDVRRRPDVEHQVIIVDRDSRVTVGESLDRPR